MTYFDNISLDAMRAVLKICHSWHGEFRLRYGYVTPPPMGFQAEDLMVLRHREKEWVAEILSIQPGARGPAPIGHGETPEHAVREMLKMAGA